MKKYIPISKPWITKREIELIQEQLLRSNLTSSSIEGGKIVQELERKIASFLKVKHVIAVNSGTSALLASLMALNISSGDEVIVPSFTFMATANAVLMVGAKPVFADITLDNYGLDPKDVERKITSKTKAIIVVHLYGYPAHIEQLLELAEKHNLAVIEDTAQALGSSVKGKYVGTFGLLGCFSMYPSKLITTAEGGFITTNDESLAQKLRMIRNHGQSEPYTPSILGLNLRLPELLAAIGIAQMERIEEIIRRRRHIAEIYSQNLPNEDLVIPTEPNHVKFNWNYYTVRVNPGIDREKLVQTLNSKGVGATVYYRVPIHRTPLYQKLGFKSILPNTELAAKTVVSLPIYPEMTKEDAEYVIEVLKTSLTAR